MRVIRQEAPEEIEVKCTGKGNGGGGCGAVLGVLWDDIYHTQSSCMGRDYTDYATVCCPRCLRLTDVDKKNIHPDWRWQDKVIFSPDEIVKKTKERYRDEYTGRD